MEDVIAAHSIMQQSVFATDHITAPDQVLNLQNVEARWRAGMIVSLTLAGAAFVASIVALVLASM